MPRFYFHLLNDMDVPDLEGMEFADLVAARANGTRQVQGLIGEMAKIGKPIVLHHRIDIEDEAGAVLDSVYFRDVVRVED